MGWGFATIWKTTNPAHDYLWFREKGEVIIKKKEEERKEKRKNPSAIEHIVTVPVQENVS